MSLVEPNLSKYYVYPPASTIPYYFYPREVYLTRDTTFTNPNRPYPKYRDMRKDVRKYVYKHYLPPTYLDMYRQSQCPIYVTQSGVIYSACPTPPNRW